MPKRQLPKTNPSRDSALTACKDKMDATPEINRPFSAAKGVELTAQQPVYHGLIAASNVAKFNQTLQTGVVAPLRHTARLWVSHGFQALINACIRGQFNKQVKNLYGIAIDSTKGPDLVTESDIEQAAVTYNDGETARIAAGGTPITFPLIDDINLQVHDLKAASLTQSTLKDAYDAAQEDLAAANPAIDLLILQLWNSIEATYDTGDKPSLRRKAREWGVVYIPSKGETPTGDDYSVIGEVTDSETELPLQHVNLVLSNASLDVNYITNEDGMYFLQTVPSGTYNLEAKLDGYQLFTTQVEVIEGEIQELNIALVPELLPPSPEA